MEKRSGATRESWNQLDRAVSVVHDAFPQAAEVKGKALLSQKPQLQKEVAKFKAAVKRVAIYCCEDSDEQVFKACRIPNKRLAEVAICNKHACIQGMPHVSEDDAIAIT